MDRRRQSISGNLVHTFLLLSILLVASSRGCVLQECIDNYNAEVVTCGSISRALNCIDPCGYSSLRINFEKQLYESQVNCSEEVTTAPPPCESQLPDFDDDMEIMELEDPIISYGSNSDSVCSPDLTNDKSHCSMFTYSHIRQFSHNTIQTCSVSGQKDLINNAKLSILVTADTDSESAYTNLQKIELYVYPDPCTGYRFLSYTASATQELPLDMAGSALDTGPNSVEFNVNSNRTVASILLPWLGTTIVIHRYAEHLGVVVHMPDEMAKSDKGLCGVGCSEDSQIDSAEQIKSYCPGNQETSMLSCKSKSGLLSELQDGQLREQYLMACQVDVLNSQAYDVISVMSAVVTTCKLLPNHDEVPTDADVSSASGSGESGSGFNDDLLPALNCTHLSGQSPNVQLLPEPEMSVDLDLLTWLPSECSPHIPKGDALRQCAMFTHSHLSPFDSYTIQTPSQPATWTLLQYDSLLVKVTGVADPTSPGFTKLETVDVTLHSPACTFGVTLSYTASASSSLPQEMTYSDPTFEEFLRPMLLHSDGNVTSMHIPMLNATIVIRRDGGFLSVVARVPAQFVPSIGGVCSGGFPDYSPDDFDNFLAEQSSICHTEYQQLLFDCFIHGQEPNFQILDNGPTFSLGFNEVCLFDVLKTLSYDGLSTIRSVGSDLALLWDVGFYVYPSVESPTDTTDSPEPSLPPSQPSLPPSQPALPSSPTQTEFSTALTHPSESPSPSSSSLAQSPSSPSVSLSPTSVSAASTEKGTPSPSIPALQETPMPTETPTEQPGPLTRPPGPPTRPPGPPTRPPGTPTKRPETPKPPTPPKPSKFPNPLEDSLLSETVSSGKTHCYTLSLLSLLVALSLTLVFHLL